MLHLQYILPLWTHKFPIFLLLPKTAYITYLHWNFYMQIVHRDIVVYWRAHVLNTISGCCDVDDSGSEVEINVDDDGKMMMLDMMIMMLDMTMMMTMTVMMTMMKTVIL